jgi:thioredoxin 1
MPWQPSSCQGIVFGIMAASNVTNITEANFSSEVLQAPVPVLVDFWAEWCGPCKAIAPIIDELANEMDGRAKFGKINVDDQSGLASQYGIRAIPTILIFKGGQVMEQVVGARGKRDLRNNLEKYLAES